MKVAVVDFDHFEMTYSLVKCLSPKAKTIDVYATAFIIGLLKQSKLPANTKMEWLETSSVADLRSTFRQGEAYDYIFLNTIDNFYSDINAVLDTIKEGKIILTVHNINFWFKKRTWLKVIKRPRSEEHHMILQVAKKVNAYLVLTPTLKAYLESKIKVKKKVLVFPYLIFEPLRKKTSELGHKKLKIVIPGIIQGGRKDHKTALEVFRQLDKRRFTLTLLGCAVDTYGTKILEDCAKMKEEGFDLSWYDAYVLPIEFDRVMANADIVLAPVQVYTRFGGVEEVYGQSKATGAEFDLIRFCKPGIFPAELQISQDLKESVLTYSSAAHLKTLLNGLLDNDSLHHLQMQAGRASGNYTPEIVSKNLFHQLKAIN